MIASGCSALSEGRCEWALMDCCARLPLLAAWKLLVRRAVAAVRLLLCGANRAADARDDRLVGVAAERAAEGGRKAEAADQLAGSARAEADRGSEEDVKDGGCLTSLSASLSLSELSLSASLASAGGSLLLTAVWLSALC